MKVVYIVVESYKATGAVLGIDRVFTEEVSAQTYCARMNAGSFSHYKYYRRSIVGECLNEKF